MAAIFSCHIKTKSSVSISPFCPTSPVGKPETSVERHETHPQCFIARRNDDKAVSKTLSFLAEPSDEERSNPEKQQKYFQLSIN